MKKMVLGFILGLVLFFSGVVGVKAMDYDECVEAWSKGCDKWHIEVIHDACVAEGMIACLF